MTFLNSALLAGLAAVAIPLIIHLFSRRRFPKIDFSTLRFLKRLQRQQMRRLKLRQWLLLLLRMLGLFLIVLGFTRPALKEVSGFGALSSGRVGMAIIVDGSASMQARSESGTCFQAAESAVEALLSSMNSGDRAMLVLAKDKPVALTATPVSDPEVLRRSLREAEPWDGSADIGSAVTFAVEALRNSPEFRSEIYVISDFTGDSLPPLPDPPAEMFPFFVHTDPESQENLSICDIRVLGEFIEPGQPVLIEFALNNHGRQDRNDVYFSLYLNDVRVAEDIVSLAAGSEVHRQIEVLPQGTGLQAGLVKCDELDVLSPDNRAYFSFSVPERLNALLVGDPETVRPLQLALTPSFLQNGLISVQKTTRESWDVGSLTGFDAVIFIDPVAFNSSQTSRLIRYVENGGGLMIFPGSRSNFSVLNRDLLAPLETPQWGEVMGKSGALNAYISWQSLDLNQPLLKGILRPGSAPSTPRFFQAVRLVGGKGEVLIHLQNGSPFLTQTRYGKGRVILAASSPEAAWSDWSQRGIFAPLLHRLTLSLAGGQKERCQSLTVGESLEIPAGSEGTAVAVLVLPDKQEIKLPPRTLGQKIVYLQPELNPAGIYTLKAGTNQYLAAANIPRDESNLKVADLSAVYPGWQKADVVITRPDDLISAVKSSRYGRELWKSALIAGLLILGLESLLGGVWSKTSRKLEEEQD